MIRYVLCPGYVTSKNDGQRHFVSYEDLRRLYGLRRDECIAWPNHAQDPRNLFTPPVGAKVLGPRYRGDYSITEDGV